MVATERLLFSARRGVRTDIDSAWIDYRPMLRAAAADPGTAARRAGEIALSFFVGADNRSPYDAAGAPLAGLPAILNYWFAWLLFRIGEQHARYLADRLPAEVRRITGLQSDEPGIFDRIDPRGLTLADRIWQAGVRTQLQVEMLVNDAIRAGVGADSIADRLDRFLRPNRADFDGNPAYGADGSLNAVRLALAELGWMYGLGVRVASRNNPYLGGIDWRLSPLHPKRDHCDQVATIGMHGERLRPPYRPESVPPYPDHPYCKCTLLGAKLGQIEGITSIFGEMLSPVDFTRSILGEYFGALTVNWK